MLAFGLTTTLQFLIEFAEKLPWELHLMLFVLLDMEKVGTKNIKLSDDGGGGALLFAVCFLS